MDEKKIMELIAWLNQETDTLINVTKRLMVIQDVLIKAVMGDKNDIQETQTR